MIPPVLPLVVIGCLLQATVLFSKPPSVDLAREGDALLPVYISSDASLARQALAKELAHYLSEISGGQFEVVNERPERGIFFASPEEAGLPPAGDPASPSARERYRLVTRDGSLYLAGMNDLAFQDAVFDLLHRLGYRQFFPGKVWEVIPREPTLSLALDEVCQPAFAFRNAFYAVRPRPEALIEATDLPRTQAEFEDWKRKNRAISGYKLQSGHAFNEIAKRHPEAFREHPEWRTTLEESADGNSFEPKFRVEHSALRDLVRDDALAWLKSNPEVDTYSVEPSDRGGWPKTSPVGTPTDQIVLLANHVARAVREAMPDKKVAFYAYNRHSKPPQGRIEPGVIVGVATHFNQGVPVAKIVQAWQERGAEIGIRDYLSVWHGDLDLPGGRYLAANPEAFFRTIGNYYRLGARYYGAEATTGGWATWGLGIYTGMQAFWSPETAQYKPIRADFLQRAFEEADRPMGEFFESIDNANSPIPSDVLFRQMYRQLKTALELKPRPAVRSRILQLVAYTRYAELVHQMQQTEGEEKVAAYEALAKFAIRCRAFPTVPVAEVFGRRAPLIAIWDQVGPVGARIMASHIHQVSEDELENLMKERLANIKPLQFQPVSYLGKLAPSPDTTRFPAANFRFKGMNRTVHWLAIKSEEELDLTVTSRTTLDAKQPITLDLIFQNAPEGEAIVTRSIPADGNSHQVTLKAGDAGLYFLRISDPAGVCEVAWPGGASVAVPAGQQLRSDIAEEYTAWFYVPAGTTEIGGYSAEPQGRMVDEDRRVIFDFATLKKGEHFLVRIQPVSSGRFFRIEGASGGKLLLTVPPYLARRPSELILPDPDSKAIPTAL